MREIKFRALKDDMSDCSFVYGELVYDAIGIPRITHKDFSGSGLKFNTCIKGTEGQFTGLHDKNGMEIYEGDIVELFGQVADIRYSTLWGGYIAWCDKMTENEDQPLCDGYNSLAKDCTVVGNIHKNKDLLNLDL